MSKLILSLLQSGWLVTAALAAVYTGMLLYFGHNPRTHPRAAHVFWQTFAFAVACFAGAAALFYLSADKWPDVATAYVLIVVPPIVVTQLLRPLH